MADDTSASTDLPTSTDLLPVFTDLSGEWRAHEAVGDLPKEFAGPGYDDGGWSPITVPGHWRSQPDFAASDGPLLYRRRVERSTLDDGRRAFLVLDGVFYYGDVWLDGDYLGATEGYFFPHGFEVTEHFRSDDEHLVAIEVACPPQRDRTAKRTLTGVFSHWDNLDPAWNPGGLWRPVRLVETGPVRLARLRLLCTEAGIEHGLLLADLTLDAGTEPPPTLHLEATVTGPDGAELARHRHDLVPAAGENHVSWPLPVEAPPRWWPWRLGDQPRCRVDVAVVVGDRISDATSRRTAFREVRMRDWVLHVNGERLFVMGSNQGPSRMALAEATAGELQRDVALAVEANLDLLRLHAHVTRPELYEAADEAGLLLWQDFPLQWGYARGVRKQAVRQARAMVDLLSHHPSIALWCAHNEPLAVDLQPGEPVTPVAALKVAASMTLPTWNKDVLDRSVARAIGRSDPTRPVDRASGLLPGPASTGTDSHLYFGWYWGDLTGLARALRVFPRLARFVSEFGAQAVPSTSDWMQPERWPDLDWAGLFEHHALQRRYFDRFVPPGEAKTFEEWRDATQAYQAALIQLQVEDLRRLQYAPTGGFTHFCFADGHPAVTWSVLDHARVPKRGYQTLRDACRAALPMIEPREGLVHVASSLREPLRDATVEVLCDGRRRRFTGDVAADGVTFVGRVDLGGAVDAEIVLEHPGVGRVVNRYPLLVLDACRPSR